MGLRTASVRRPYVEVMAPALTETTQSSTFKLPPKDHLHPASPINGFEAGGKCLPDVRGALCDRRPLHEPNKPPVTQCSSEPARAPANGDTSDIIMSDSPMGDQNLIDTMGLQKTGLDLVSKMQADNTTKATNDVDQILNNLASTLPPGELPQNDEELLQVINSITTNPPADMNLEKFLTDVDMMNMSMEEQPELDPSALKQTKSKELIAELKVKQAKAERRLDFLRRKVHKLQARHMGLHVGGEVAGVYEHVHRALKRLKDLHDQQPPSTSSSVVDDDKPKPISYGSTKSLLKKLEMTAVLQANSSAVRQRPLTRYFGAGSAEPTNYRCNIPGVVNIPPWPQEYKQELQKTSGLLKTELGILQHEVDSEATESSSGGESCDEMQNYNNPHQQYLGIQKRALWKYNTSRASIAARWTWLQSQISDLEYRIRQHSDLHRQIRASKGPVQLGGASPPPLTAVTTPAATVNGYRGQLPGSSPLPTTTTTTTTKAAESGIGTATNGAYPDCQCARTRPLTNLKKRRLVQIGGLHVYSKKAARPSTVRCGCAPPVQCAVCTGRTDPTHPRDPPDVLSKAERVALVDPAFHPVFSLPEDVSCAVHCDAIMKTSDWQQRSSRMKSIKVSKSDRSEKNLMDHRSNKKLDHRKKYGRVLKPSTASALSAKIKNKMRGRKIGRLSSSSSSSAYRLNNRKRSTAKVAMAQFHALAADGALDEELESIGNNSLMASNSVAASPSSSPLLHMQAISGFNRRNRSNSYDIDNIVIPYSVAASTRVEKLQYKEILTPKWRIADPEPRCDNNTKNNGAVRNPSQDSDAEDLCEDAVVGRHDRCEHDEKKRFLSYLKFPLGHGRHRSHKRTDSLAESSGANTPNAMSPHPVDGQENATSPLTSPPATPLPATVSVDEPPLPSVSLMRRRTISQSRFVRDREMIREDNGTPETVEVAPFDSRTFPLDEDTYDKMLRNMPENHQFKTNDRAQDSTTDFITSLSYLDEKVDSPGTESTESALGDEDPNDPEWVDMESSASTRDRHNKR